jgi:hypothetical protein
VRGADARCLPAELLGDPLKHTVDVIDDVVVPKSQDRVTLGIEPRGSLQISLDHRRVLSTVQFDHQLTLEAGKIDNVSTDDGLSAEFAGFDLSTADAIP